MEVSPAVALGMFTVGVLLIYFELNRPGRVIPGAVGLLLTLLACARLAAAHPGFVGVVLVVTAGALLAMELVWGANRVVAVAATLAMVLGFRQLVVPPMGWMVCILYGVGLGGVTAVLTRVALRARANKTKPGKAVN